ncbi:hypothetical protein RR48_07405 [Papilio machaon]|uniref:Uncharacterized protein n=1 Tax=Papilio machaon TaxID=76193 RepID=A0A194RUJ1_PAPMA|nr:hypothetical protein RR48_07405 [Papilio machaon]
MQQDKVPEPIEVRLLKQKLACFACKCLNCEKYSRFNRLNAVKNGESTGVQVDNIASDRFSKVRVQDRIDDKSKKIDKATGSSFISTLCNNYICPSCQYIVEFLRENLNKVFKDAESETKPLDRCDKSTEKTIDHLDKTTSMIKCDSSCAMKKKFSAEFIKAENKERKSEKVVFVDSVKGNVSDLESNIKVTIDKDKKENVEKYKNVITENDKTVNIEKQTSPDAEKSMYLDTKHSTGVPKQYMCGNCVCVEKFINAIRPYA